MLYLRSGPDLPHPERFRRGAIGVMLVVILTCAFLIVPYGLAMADRCFDWLIIQRSHQYARQVLTTAGMGLSQSDLAAGRLKMQTITTRQMMADFFHDNCPPVLQGRLALQRIRFTHRLPEQDGTDWTGDLVQSQPIVILEAILVLSCGRTVAICHAVEIFLD